MFIVHSSLGCLRNKDLRVGVPKRKARWRLIATFYGCSQGGGWQVFFFELHIYLFEEWKQSRFKIQDALRCEMPCCIMFTFVASSQSFYCGMIPSRNKLYSVDSNLIPLNLTTCHDCSTCSGSKSANLGLLQSLSTRFICLLSLTNGAASFGGALQAHLGRRSDLKFSALLRLASGSKNFRRARWNIDLK